MSTSPPAPLLRLREADVVRLCGLDAAARGLELVARHAVTRGRRAGGRLEAMVEDGGECAAWVALAVESAPAGLRWGCARDAPDATPEVATEADHPPVGMGCAHAAALLAAWIRRPDDFFVVPAAPDTLPDTHAPPPAEAPPPPRPRMSQPALLAPRRTARPRGAATLAEELARLPAVELLAIARRVLGSELGGEVAEREARRQLGTALADPILLDALVARLEPAAGALLGGITLLGGAVTSADLDALAERSGQPASALRATVAVLERHGLLFRAPGAGAAPGATAERGWRQLAGWRVPPEIRAALTPILPLDSLPATRERAGVPALPPEAAGRNAVRLERGSPRVLCLALALLARAPAPLGPLGPLAFGSAADRLAAAPGRSGARTFALVPGDLAPERLAELVRGAGLAPGPARMARRVLLWAREQGAGQPLTDLAAVPAAERALALRAGFRVWLAAEVAAELADLDLEDSPVRARYDPGHPAFRLGALATEAAEARAFVARLLARARPGAWYAVDALLDLIWRLQPLFLRGRQRAYTTPAWWLEPAGGGRPLRPTDREEWRAGEGEYLRLLLRGPLYWWGAVDLARDASGRAAAFRLTPFGAFLLGHDEATAERDGLGGGLGGDWGPAILATREGAIAAQPLVAGAALLDALAEWARPTAIAGGRLVYSPSPDLACAAFDRGARADGLLGRLRGLGDPSAARVAELLAARVGAWRARYGQTRIARGMALIEASDEAALAEALARAPEIATRCRRLGPTLVLVLPDDVPTLRKLLARHGYHL